MATPCRPSLVNRTISTPPTTPGAFPSFFDSKAHSAATASSVLTPPHSPRESRSLSNMSDLATPAEVSQLQPSDASNFHERQRSLEPIQTDSIPQPISLAAIPVSECPFDVEILKDARGRDAVFGSGAWSIVYKGTTHPKSRAIAESFTPPSSPMGTTPVLVAVKTPTRRDSSEILRSEAKILSYLHMLPHSDKFVVPFYGTVNESTIILAAIPLSLEQHVRNCAVNASQNASTWTMHEPVIGSTPKWLHLATQMISALAWLHSVAGVVHGDIKPGNILLSHVQGTGDDMTFHPIFVDFSSAQLLDVDETTPNTLSAVTREYTAPELLSAKVLRDPESTATTASDVFSLAVTLLVAATGQLLVYPGSLFQRQLMATQGWMVLSHVRNGEQGARVPRMGVVERVLERAVLKEGMGRITALDWLEFVEEVGKGEPVKS